MSRARAIIYDCDGVLFDSRPANQAFFNHILRHFDKPPLTPEQLDFAHASTSKEAVDYLFRDSPLREEAQAFRESVDYAQFLPFMRPETCMREVLELLHPHYRTAIATNRSFTMPLVMCHFKLDTLFDMVVTSLDVTHPKPHAESLEKILQRFGIAPDHALYIGDTEVDSLMSQRAGVPFAAYKNRGLKASFHMETHLDILKALGWKPPAANPKS